VRAALIVLIACKAEPAAETAAEPPKLEGCAALLTAAEVEKACGAAVAIEKSPGEGMTTKFPDGTELHHLCYRDITFRADGRRMGLVVSRIETAQEIVASNRELSKQHAFRDIDGKAYFAAMAPGPYATKEVLGARGHLMYKLSDLWRAGTPWLCSDDGMVELGRLVDKRITTLQRGSFPSSPDCVRRCEKRHQLAYPRRSWLVNDGMT
jgi:hypothetical protein